MIIDKGLMDIIPPDADYKLTARREAYHYFCNLEVKWKSYSIALNASSNELKTAVDTLFQELKEKLSKQGFKTIKKLEKSAS